MTPLHASRSTMQPYASPISRRKAPASTKANPTPLSRISTGVLYAILVLISYTGISHAEPLVIASEGKSDFSIVVPHIAAHSVNDAAAELQRCIFEATGATLPIIKDDEAISTPFISLGSTAQATAASIVAPEVEDGGYRILSQEGNLYIIGLDTTARDRDWVNGRVRDQAGQFEEYPEIPGPAFTKNGGFSQGTANGVYSFLEKSLDVRWLLPGELGRDIPERPTFSIDPIDETVSPLFSYRVISFLGSGPHAGAWRAQMKLGYSFRLNHHHAWAEIVPASLFNKHPDWFPMNANGERVTPKDRNYKLETTNPELVNYVAEKAIAALKESPNLNTFSLSPTDSLGYSLSPESQALYDQGTITQYSGAPSATPLILDFYREVSDIVARTNPQGKLAGYFYQQYRHPPSSGEAEIPKNFVPVLVAAASSYRGYRPEMQAEEASILQGWGKIFRANSTEWFYYGHPAWLRDSTAMIAPAIPEFFNFFYTHLVENQCKGMFDYGIYSWSHGALVNYISAKKLWDPQADAVAIQGDWLRRAYGPEAGAVMEKFYNKMDESWFADYFRQPNTSGGQISEDFFRETYGKYYPEMEALILQAEAQAMTPIQKERLNLIIDNMRILQWRMRNAGYLDENYASAYTINADQVYEMVSTEEFRTRGVPKRLVEIDPIEVRVEHSAPSNRDEIPNPDSILLFPTKDGEISLKPTLVRPGSSFLYYSVQDQDNRILQRGLMENETEITFPVEANRPYYFQTKHGGVRSNPQVKWGITIPQAIAAEATFSEARVSLQPTSSDEETSLYVYTPAHLDLQVEKHHGGLRIATLTNEEDKSKTLRAARIAAEDTLNSGLTQYRARLVQNFDSSWKFAIDPEKEGVAKGYAEATFNDKSWDKIWTVGSWHSHGFDDYYGTAWYRKTFTLSSADNDAAQLEDQKLLLFVGAVDGDAVFYLNGEKIAERAQSPNSWLESFAIDVSPSIIIGKNVLAVEISKDRYAAGLYKGVSLIAGDLTGN